MVCSTAAKSKRETGAFPRPRVRPVLMSACLASLGDCGATLETNGYEYAPMEFQERLQAGKDAELHRDRAYLGARIVTARKPLRCPLSVDQVADILRCSPARVRLLCGQRRIKGARRIFGKGAGRGKGWRIVGHLQADGSYRPIILERQKGPKLVVFREVVPF